MGNLTSEICCNCGIEFAMPTQYRKTLQENHKSFSCPNGHKQYFNGETDAEKYKRQYEYANNRADSAENDSEFHKKQASVYKGHFTRLKNKGEEE
jgi:hypothetical protein